MAGESSASSVSGAPNGTIAPASTQTETQTADARSPDQPSKSSKSSGTLEQFARAAAKNPQKPAVTAQSADKTDSAVEDDDPEFDFDGEKYKKSQLAELAKKRREYDRAAAQRFEEAAKIRKQVEAREAAIEKELQQFRENPWGLFEHAGVNPDEAAEKRLAQQLKRQQMSPEAIELERAQAELQKLKTEQQQFAEQQKKQKHEQQVQHWAKFFADSIASAMESGSIPRNAHTGQRVRQAYEDLVDAGHAIDDTTGALAVDIARERMMTETQHLLGDLAKSSPKMLVELLGGLDGEIVKAVQRLAVERHEATAQPRPKQQQQVTPLKQKSKGPETFEEVRKRLGIA